jgi:hypothetical protein
MDFSHIYTVYKWTVHSETPHEMNVKFYYHINYMSFLLKKWIFALFCFKGIAVFYFMLIPCNTALYIRCLSNWNTIGQISYKNTKAFMALDTGGSEIQAIKNVLPPKVLEKLYTF